MTSYNTHIHDITVVHEIYADKQNYITLDIIQFLQNKSKIAYVLFHMQPCEINFQIIKS